MSNYVVDLDKELDELLKKEEIFAFFDIQIPTPSKKMVSGLCRVSKPKMGESKSVYFSLLFILDIPDSETWRETDNIMNNIPWDEFEKHSKRVRYVLPMFSQSLKSGNYFKEVCLYVSNMGDFSRDYLFEILFPIVSKITGFKTGELIFLDESLT